MTPRMFSSTRKCWPRPLLGVTLTVSPPGEPPGSPIPPPPAAHSREAEGGRRVRVDLRPERNGIFPPRVGERGNRVDHERGLVRLPANRLRSQVRRVGLGEDAISRD